MKVKGVDMKKKKKTYVSHRFEDESKAKSSKSFFKEGGGTINSKPLYVKDKNARSKHDIDKTIKKAMKDADNILIVNGDNSHSSKWQRREIELAKSSGKKRVVTNVPGSKGGVQPELKKDRGAKQARWKQKDIKKALK